MITYNSCDSQRENKNKVAKNSRRVCLDPRWKSSGSLALGPLAIGRRPNHKVLSDLRAKFHRLQLHSYMIPSRLSIRLQGRKRYLHISATKLSSILSKDGLRMDSDGGAGEGRRRGKQKKLFFPLIF